MFKRRATGFTLIELMVTIAVVAILLAIALPSFQGALRSNRVTTATNEMIASLSLARSEAIRNKGGAGVCPSSNGTACVGNWSDGWLVWADANGNSALDIGEVVLRYSQGNPGLAVSNSGGTVVFDPRGRRRSAGGQTLALRPSECSSQPLQRTLTVNASGQVTAVKGACS